MKYLLSILAGLAVAGIVTRICLPYATKPLGAQMAARREPESLPAPAPPPPAAVRAEVRKAVTMTTSAEEANAGGFRVAMHHPNESELVRLLARRGGRVVAANDGNIYYFDQGSRVPVSQAEWIGSYQFGQAWEISGKTTANQLGLELQAGDRTYVVMPTEFEKTLTTAIEGLLPEPIGNFVEAHLEVQQTPGGHLRWVLTGAEHRQKGKMEIHGELRGI